MDHEIKNIKLAFACPQNWEAMHPTEGGRHCDKCSKTVYDLTNSKADEFRKILLEQKGEVCGHFRADQLGHQTAKMPLWKRWVPAALLVIASTLFSCKQKTEVKVTTGVPLIPLDSTHHATGQQAGSDTTCVKPATDHATSSKNAR